MVSGVDAGPARGLMASFLKCRARCNEPEVCHDSPVAKIPVQFGRRPPGGSRRISASGATGRGRSAELILTAIVVALGSQRQMRTRRQSPLPPPRLSNSSVRLIQARPAFRGLQPFTIGRCQARQSGAECGFRGRDIYPADVQSIWVTIPVNSLKSTEESGMDDTMYDALKMKASPSITYVLRTPT